MADKNIDKIGIGKPLATGGITVLGADGDLPGSALAPIVGGTRLGYVAKDGLRPTGERSSGSIEDWNGDEIAAPQESYTSGYQFKLYSTWDIDVLKEVYGHANVTITGAEIKVIDTGDPLDIHPWIFDMRMGGAKRKRIEIPLGQLTSITEDPYVVDALHAYDCTLKAFKDAYGAFKYEHLNDGSAPAAPTITSRAPSGNLATAGGEILILSGLNFVGTTSVKFGVANTDALDFQVINDQTLSVITPAKTAGAHSIVVANAVGNSSGFSVTYA